MFERLAKWILSRHKDNNEVRCTDSEDNTRFVKLTASQAAAIEAIMASAPYFMVFRLHSRVYTLSHDIDCETLLDALRDVAAENENFKTAITDMVIDLNQ